MSISFTLDGKQLLFINCHLDAHIPKRRQRNIQWKRIKDYFVAETHLVNSSSGISGLCLSSKAKKGELKPLLAGKQDRWDAVIWLGDFNSRLQKQPEIKNEKVNRAASELLISKNQYTELAEHDQFTSDIKKTSEFENFKEGVFQNFAPTFKIYKNQDRYREKRNPAWTDRIIYRGETLQQLNYESNNLVKISDHRPIFSQFLLSMSQMYVEQQTPKQEQI